MPPPTNQPQLEQAVMTMLLDGNDPTLNILRQQYHLATIASRELSGAGFFLNFSIPSHAPRLPANASLQLGNVIAKIDGLRHGAGFVLFINHGILDFLEGYSYNEPWSATITNFHLSYTDNK
jgi:hypothetical protein